MQAILIWKRLPVFLVGLIVFFVAERYLAAESFHAIVRGVALALCGIGLGMTLLLSVLASGKGFGKEAKAWRYTALWQLGMLAALGLYLAYRAALGDAAAPETFTHKALLAAWLLLSTLSLAAGAGLEWAHRESGRGKFAEPQRVGHSGSAWFLIGMLLAILVAVNYVAAQKDVTRDWSYLKVTSPSASTLATLKTLTSDVQIVVFYPGGNDVLTYVKQYFDQIVKAEPRVKLSYYDKDLQPTKAEEFRVSRNGQIVFDVAGKRSRIDTGTTLAKARKTLRNLDQEFQKAFLEITSDKKTVYFTRGHGEASWVGDGADDPLRSLALLEGFLRQQNYTLKLFGIGEGSSSAVPDDAAAVVIAGPTQAFQKEEVEALKAFVDKGGNLMVFFDLAKGTGEQTVVTPVGPDPLGEFVRSAGIRFNEVPLGNDKNFVAATRSPADNWFIFSNVFTSHESVVSLARHDERIAVLVFQGGHLSVVPQSGSWKASETVRALSDTYVDTNKNFKNDPGEKRDSYVLGAVAEPKTPKIDPKTKKPGGRIVAFADATVLSDALVRNPGNLVFFADSLKWLVGDVERTGEVASEEDVKIRHTRKEDVVWFHATVIVVPLLVLGAGYFATRRKRGANGSGGGGAATTQEKTDAA